MSELPSPPTTRCAPPTTSPPLLTPLLVRRSHSPNRLALLLDPSRLSTPAETIGSSTSTLCSLRSLACCASGSEFVRLAAMRSLTNWLFTSCLVGDNEKEQAMAVAALLAVCDSRESEELQEEAARAVSSLAKLPSLRPILVRLSGGRALLNLLPSARVEQGESGALLARVLIGLCQLSDEPACCSQLTLSTTTTTADSSQPQPSPSHSSFLSPFPSLILSLSLSPSTLTHLIQSSPGIRHSFSSHMSLSDIDLTPADHYLTTN